jgi:hypothetical protein
MIVCRKGGRSRASRQLLLRCPTSRHPWRSLRPRHSYVPVQHEGAKIFAIEAGFLCVFAPLWQSQKIRDSRKNKSRRALWNPPPNIPPRDDSTDGEGWGEAGNGSREGRSEGRASRRIQSLCQERLTVRAANWRIMPRPRVGAARRYACS